ncbi:MAG TPA: hypothetical protein VLC95_01430 [Anaerolineae bacterium]|nr:hypothetical protein [Anaerolineae bacterium]
MQEIWTYHVEMHGPLDERAFNATSPLAVTVVQADRAATCCAVCTDQSGLIGLLRHFHRQGFVLLSIQRGPHLEGG